MLDTVYNVVGAASGTVTAVAEVGKKEAKAATSSLTSHALATLSHLQAAVSARARNTANKLYSLAGALSGVVNGAKYAGLSLWWYISEDEIKIKLIQGSPVKYKLKDLESLVQNHSNTTQQYQQQYNNGNGVSSDSSSVISVGAPVTSSNDHLAEQKHQQGIRRRSEDFGSSVDESVKNTAAAKSNTLAPSAGVQSKDRRHKKKSLPTTPQQQEEYSPRVLA